jgi:hypothetical protein
VRVGVPVEEITIEAFFRPLEEYEEVHYKNGNPKVILWNNLMIYDTIQEKYIEKPNGVNGIPADIKKEVPK